MKDFRQSIKKLIVHKKNKYIKINTEDKKEVVVDVKEIIKKEKNISETFKFELTKSYYDIKSLM